MGFGNKKQFSGKLKKKILKEKKLAKKNLNQSSDEEENTKTEMLINSDDYLSENEESIQTEIIQPEEKKPCLDELNFNSDNIYMINSQPNRTNKDVNRFALQFYKETDDQIRKKKEEATKEFKKLKEVDLETDLDLENESKNMSLPFPKRPKWNKSLTKEKLLSNEYLYFKEYLKDLENKYGSLGNLSYFEMNLETWRQLWRTLEMSDVVLLITDIRYSVFHFPSTLYNYIKNDLKKQIILVLNKSDLIPAELVIAWVEFWKKKFPDINVIPFSSYAGMRVKNSGKFKGKRFGKFSMATESVKQLYSVCQKIVDNQIDISSWESKIEYDLGNIDAEQMKKEVPDEVDKESNEHLWSENSIEDKLTNRRLAAKNLEKSKIKKTNRKAKQRLKNLKKTKKYVRSNSESDTESELENGIDNIKIQEQSYDYHEFKPLDKGVLTIGCIGHPNVGKSSVLNAIMGKIVVSVSRTPGHTKHFQTIFLTDNVKLCDCPGLVFPSKIPKQLQILMGCFPIAQLREPYSSITYIAERLDLIKILKIKKSEDYENQGWSSMEICEQWATKRGFFTAKGARPDVYRAANQILRMALDGRTICLTFYPPNYIKEKESIWKKHPDLEFIRFLQCQTSKIPEKEREFKKSKNAMYNLENLRPNSFGDYISDSSDPNSLESES